MPRIYKLKGFFTPSPLFGDNLEIKFRSNLDTQPPLTKSAFPWPPPQKRTIFMDGPKINLLFITPLTRFAAYWFCCAVHLESRPWHYSASPTLMKLRASALPRPFIYRWTAVFRFRPVGANSHLEQLAANVNVISKTCGTNLWRRGCVNRPPISRKIGETCSFCNE